MRLSEHRSKYKQYLKGNYHWVTSFKLFELGPVDIELIENYSCSDKNELHAREAHFIRTLECVNKNIPGRTDKEYRSENKDKMKKYRRENKESILVKKKQYYQENKESILVKKKQYRDENKESIAKKKEIGRASCRERV